MAEAVELKLRVEAQVKRIGGRYYARLEPWTLIDVAEAQQAGDELSAPESEWLLGDEALRLLRALRQAYYADALRWGDAQAGQDDGLRFMQAFERLMCGASPKLQGRIMNGGAHSEPQHTTLEVP